MFGLLARPHGDGWVDLVTLAAMLSHSRTEMVSRYAHPTEEHPFQRCANVTRLSPTLMNRKRRKRKKAARKEKSGVTSKPSLNRNLAAAKAAKQDEFYTQYVDIQKEIEAYLEFDPATFRG